MERAVRNLHGLHLLQYAKENLDFENAEIVSNMSPESIHHILSQVENKPLIFKNILDEWMYAWILIFLIPYFMLNTNLTSNKSLEIISKI